MRRYAAIGGAEQELVDSQSSERLRRPKWMEPDLGLPADCLLRTLESDRARVASALSEQVAPVITMARYLIEYTAQRFAPGELEGSSQDLQTASARLRGASHQLMAVCLELRPRVLDDLGLLPALAWYLREFGWENRPIQVSPRITLTEREIPVELKLAVFRIAQAALGNVARHSKASRVQVFLSRSQDELRLGVEDNGVGFDAERWRRARLDRVGCGLQLIRRWVKTSGGRCSIEAIPGHGARIHAYWPVRKDES